MGADGRQRLQTGFTLLEVMLAVIVLGVVLSTLYLTWSAGLQGWKAGADAADELQKTRSILDGLGEMFRSAAYYDQGDTTDQNDNLYQFEGIHGTVQGTDLAADSVTFVTLSSRFLRPYEAVRMPLRWVKISLEQDENKKPYLALSSESALQTDDAPPSPPQKLSGEVIGFRVRYYDADVDDWQDEWKDEVGLPAEVEITLTYQMEGDNRTSVVQQMFALIPAHEATEGQPAANSTTPLRTHSMQ